MWQALLIFLIGVAGCTGKKDVGQSEYYVMVEKWEAVYSGSDQKAAYQETLALIDYMKRMERDGVSWVDIPKVMIWNYARLGLLADHLGKKDEASHFFAIAVRYAKKAYPSESTIMTSEAGLRWALDQMDTPDKVAWRKNGNAPTATTDQGPLLPPVSSAGTPQH